MDVVKTAYVKTEVFETEEVKMENELVDKEDIKTEKELTSGIVVDDGILDFCDEKIIPANITTEGGNYIDDDVKESFHLSSKQNCKMIEEVKSDFNRSLKTNYLHPVIKTERQLVENPVNEVIFSTYGQLFPEKIDPFQVRNVNKSLTRKANDIMALYCQSVHDKHGYEYTSNLETDLTFHLNEKPFKCSSSFAHKYNLATHNQPVCLKEKPYECNDCSFSCRRKSGLAIHIRSIHLKEKPFRCSKCEYSFIRECYLAAHVRSVHLKEKIFKCTKCEYCCSVKGNLVAHIQAVHLKEKRFKCTECEYSSCYKSALVVHNRALHLKAKPFKCSECEYTCSRKSQVETHVRSIHLKEKPFRCTKCDKLFSQKSNLSTHIRSIHKLGTPGGAENS